MRSTAKILAAAALAVISASSFAAPTNWTGVLPAASKVMLILDNTGTGGSVVVTGTGSACKWGASTGAMTFTADSSATNEMVIALYNTLLQAKIAGTAVTLNYESASTVCPISTVTR